MATSRRRNRPNTKVAQDRRRRLSRTSGPKRAPHSRRSSQSAKTTSPEVPTALPRTITLTGIVPILPGLWKLFEGLQDLGSLSIGFTCLLLAILIFIYGFGLQACNGVMAELSESGAENQEHVRHIAKALAPVFSLLFMPQTARSGGTFT